MYTHINIYTNTCSSQPHRQHDGSSDRFYQNLRALLKTKDCVQQRERNNKNKPKI